MNRRWVAAWLFWLGGVAGGVAAEAPAAPKDARVVVEGESLTVNGKKIDLPGDPAGLTAALGKPRETRKSDATPPTPLGNVVLTWDDAGVCAYVDPKSGKAFCVLVALRRGAFSFSPKAPFAGALTVDGVGVTAGSTPAAINRERKGEAFKTNDALPTWWKVGYPDRVVLIETTADGKGIVFVAVESKKK